MLFLALTSVFLICWNEQKYPLTRRGEVFITAAKKRTVMCLCGVTGRSGQFYSQTSDNVLTGRWQGPVTTDRTCPVALNPYWNLTVLDRTMNPQGLVIDSLLWNLTGVDRTLVFSVRSLDHSASGRTERSLLIK